MITRPIKYTAEKGAEHRLTADEYMRELSLLKDAENKRLNKFVRDVCVEKSDVFYLRTQLPRFKKY